MFFTDSPREYNEIRSRMASPSLLSRFRYQRPQQMQRLQSDLITQSGEILFYIFCFFLTVF